MSDRAKKIAAIGGGVLVLGAGAFLLLGNRDIAGSIPGIGNALAPPICPLTGAEPRNDALAERPAVAVKVENAEIAYPLSGLEDAELVYEELVEGGATRFMAVYHCNDSDKVGPVRSARAVDPSIMVPVTRILGFSGANAPVRDALDRAEVVQVEESNAGAAMQRVPREGLSVEHTLYASTAPLRKLGAKKFDEAPPEMFEFGDLQEPSKKASTVTINFSAARTIRYDWSGDTWQRFEADQPFMTEAGEQIAVENVLVEQHTINLSTILDPAGNPSTEIADETGSGKAVLFRDGRAIVGTWTREDVEGPVEFTTKDGDAFVFSEGSIWVELVPSKKGEVKGSFSYAK